jgi:hypothetical protein
VHNDALILGSVARHRQIRHEHLATRADLDRKAVLLKWHGVCNGLPGHFAGDRIAKIYVVRNPDKVVRLG